MPTIRCVIHGSFRKHLSEVRHAMKVFTDAGIEILAPKSTEVSGEADGFVFFDGEKDKDPRLVELLYLHNVKKLGRQGFSYFVNPEGYIGKSASYELGIAQVTNVPCFFAAQPDDHPAYVHRNSVWKPEALAEYIVEKNALPGPLIAPDEIAIHQLWEDLMVPGSVVAAGGIIRYDEARRDIDKEVLLVKTHKWGDRYSIIGGKVRRNETLVEAMKREIKEESGLDSRIDSHLCTFDQIKHSGYYQPHAQHIFVDYAVSVNSKQVRLNDEAQGYIWARPKDALKDLDIEPNARHTLELYVQSLEPAVAAA